MRLVVWNVEGAGCYWTAECYECIRHMLMSASLHSSRVLIRSMAVKTKLVEVICQSMKQGVPSCPPSVGGVVDIYGMKR